MNTKKQLNSPLKESRAIIQNYFSLKERVTKSKGLNFCALAEALESPTMTFYCALKRRRTLL